MILNGVQSGRDAGVGWPSLLPFSFWSSGRDVCRLAGIVFAAGILIATSSLQAGDELKFAVPADGRITLGVFDGTGKLVRVLHKLAKEEDFRIGDNGLITTWDGKNDKGERVPAGAYYVRGYLIGDEVSVSGENFLFNDWAADPGFPNFKRIGDFSLLENGDLVLLADGGSGGNLLARFSQEKGFLWSVPLKWRSSFSAGKVFSNFRKTDPSGHPLGSSAALIPSPAPPPDFSPLLASNSTEAFVITSAGNGIYSLGDGKETFSSAAGGRTPLALAANDSRIFVGSKAGLTTISLPLQMPDGTDVQSVDEAVGPLPSVFTSMDADPSNLLGASPEGVWIRKDAFSPVTLPATVKDVSLGMSGTFWFVGVENEMPLVGQASFAGEILRLLRPAEGDPKPDKIRASRTAEKFVVLESLNGLQRLRVMSKAESGEWLIDWERTLRESSHFGFVDGKPTADTGGAPQDKDIRVRLKENPLTGKRDFLTLHVDSDSSGSRLVSPDGLPLVDISTRADIRRGAIYRGDKADTLRLLQGNGAFVEEFAITGLGDILPLDAGGVDIP